MGTERDGWGRGRVGESVKGIASLPHPLSPSPSPALRVTLPGPLDIPASVEMFRRNGDDLIDRWDGNHLVRTVPVDGVAVAYVCAVGGTLDLPMLTVAVEDEAHRESVEQVLRSSFVMPTPDFQDLLRRDPVLARLNALFPGVRPVLQHDLLSALVCCISTQQVKRCCSQLHAACRRRTSP